MINQPSEDPSTAASIEINGREVKSISGFSVSIDVMQLGDPFTLTVPNPRGVWTDVLIPGAAVKLRLSNPNVNGNKPSLMHTGRVTGRRRSSTLGGSVIQLQAADLGWHLLTHYPRPHQLLQSATFGRLLDWAIEDKSWGIKGVVSDPETARRIRLAEIGGRQAAEAAASNDLIIFLAQVEPGMSLASMLITFAKRFNRLINMSPDGYLQIFAPNYYGAPSYRIDYHEYDSPDSVRNNILSADISEDIEHTWTKVYMVGQVVGYQLYDPNAYNPGKFIGTAEAVGDDLLPFTHEFSFSDGEAYQKGWANKAAAWRLKRGLWDSWTATYKVRGHWQMHGGRARWWLPDSMVEVHDEVHGLNSIYYCSAVTYERTAEGDSTTVTLKKPYLLDANFINVLEGK